MEARLAEGEPGLRGSRRTAGAPQRGTCEAPPIRHGKAVTPSPPGKGRGWLRSGGAPLRSPRFAWGCALRHRGERRRPPAEADGGYSGSSGHGARTETSGGYLPGVRGRQPRFRGSRGQCPLGNLHDRVAVRPLRTVSPASAARPPRAGPSRKPHDTPTRAQPRPKALNPFARMGVQRAMQPSGRGAGGSAPCPFLLDYFFFL